MPDSPWVMHQILVVDYFEDDVPLLFGFGESRSSHRLHGNGECGDRNSSCQTWIVLDQLPLGCAHGGVANSEASPSSRGQDTGGSDRSANRAAATTEDVHASMQLGLFNKLAELKSTRVDFIMTGV